MTPLTRSPKRIDTVFAAFAHQHRRDVFRCLTGTESPVAVADLARDVAARKAETTSAEVADEEAKRVYLSLYHVHLPKLDELNLVRYDPAQKTVALAESAGRLERFQPHSSSE